MPELPEVETIVRALREGGREGPPIVGSTIKGARVYWKRTIAEPGVAAFKDRISGQRVQAVRRRGKFIVFQLSSGTLLFHLRMSGDLKVEKYAKPNGKSSPAQAHDRLILDFTNGKQMIFNDTRKFGRVWLVKDARTVLEGLGPEPLDPALTPKSFFTMLNSKSRQLKPLLLDQNFLAGLGNIYSDEALHLAKLHPLLDSRDVTLEQATTLLKSIRRVLREGIKRNGASIDWVYRGGDFQNYFRLYQRTGEPCPVCGTPVQRIVLGQRGTHFCPNCQSLQEEKG